MCGANFLIACQSPLFPCPNQPVPFGLFLYRFSCVTVTSATVFEGSPTRPWPQQPAPTASLTALLPTAPPPAPGQCPTWTRASVSDLRSPLPSRLPKLGPHDLPNAFSAIFRGSKPVLLAFPSSRLVARPFKMPSLVPSLYHRYSSSGHPSPGNITGNSPCVSHGVVTA